MSCTETFFSKLLLDSEIFVAKSLLFWMTVSSKQHNYKLSKNNQNLTGNGRCLADMPYNKLTTSVGQVIRVSVV